MGKEQLIETIEETGGLNTISIHLPEDNSIARDIIITEATSRRHAQGVADAVERKWKDSGEKILGKEGYENAEWILIDCNEVIVHIMRKEARELYRLEELWNNLNAIKDEQ